MGSNFLAMLLLGTNVSILILREIIKMISSAVQTEVRDPAGTVSLGFHSPFLDSSESNLAFSPLAMML